MNTASSTEPGRRIAGLVYLVMIISAAGGYATMTGLLAGDPQAVLERLAASHTRFVLAFAAMTIGFLAWVVLVFLFYRLIGSFGPLAGTLMLIFTAAGVATNLAALAHLLPLVGSSGPGMDVGALASMVGSYNRVLLLSQVFSGLWLFPYGWLLLRSRIAPRLLGWCLIIGGVGYLCVFATAFVPSLDQMMAYKIVGMITAVLAIFGELGVCFWLLFKGARGPDLARAT